MVCPGGMPQKQLAQMFFFLTTNVLLKENTFHDWVNLGDTKRPCIVIECHLSPVVWGYKKEVTESNSAYDCWVTQRAQSGAQYLVKQQVNWWFNTLKLRHKERRRVRLRHVPDSWIWSVWHPNFCLNRKYPLCMIPLYQFLLFIDVDLIDRGM